MTTYIPFTPSPTAPFQFSAMLDGASYTGTVRWNTAGQRWYVTLTDSTGTVIFTLPLIGSPVGSDIPLTAGYFTSTLVYREGTQTFEVSP